MLKTKIVNKNTLNCKKTHELDDLIRETIESAIETETENQIII